MVLIVTACLFQIRIPRGSQEEEKTLLFTTMVITYKVQKGMVYSVWSTGLKPDSYLRSPTFWLCDLGKITLTTPCFSFLIRKKETKRSTL